MLKSLYDKLQDILCCHTLPNNYKRLDATLEKKMMEIKRNPSRNINFRSIDSIIMKFPQFREGLKEIREIFEQYGGSKIMFPVLPYKQNISEFFMMILFPCVLALIQMKIQMVQLTMKSSRNAYMRSSLASVMRRLMIFSATVTWMKRKGYSSKSS